MSSAAFGFSDAETTFGSSNSPPSSHPIYIAPLEHIFAPPLPVRLLLGGSSALVAKATFSTPPAFLLLQDVPFMSLLVFVRLLLSRVGNVTSRRFLPGNLCYWRFGNGLDGIMVGLTDL